MTHPDTDFHAWALEAAERVRARKLTEEDYDWIAEELEDMGKNRQHALKRQLRRLLMHLLKGQYPPKSNQGSSWKLTLWNAREEIADLLEESPSLSRFFTASARKSTHRRGGLKRACVDWKRTFPKERRPVRPSRSPRVIRIRMRIQGLKAQLALS
jgi:hypothetical protein